MNYSIFYVIKLTTPKFPTNFKEQSRKLLSYLFIYFFFNDKT